MAGRAKISVGNAMVGTNGYRPAPQAVPAWKAMRRVMQLVMMGYPDKQIVQMTSEEFGSAERTMSQYLKAAVCALDDRNRGWKDKIVERNYNRLNAIIEDAYEHGDRKSALTAIDIQNKLAGAYEQKIKFDTPIFEIKIGNNDSALDQVPDTSNTSVPTDK